MKHSEFDFLARLLILLLVCFSGMTAYADLTWQESGKSILADLGADKESTTFGFTNNGSNPVQILLIKPSCSCLTATSASKIVAPGQSGKISVDYHPQIDRFVEKNGWIAVISKSGASKKTDLLRVNVQTRRAIAFDPSELKWNVGERSSKSVNVISLLPEERPILITSVQALGMNAKINPAGTGFTLAPPANSKRASIKVPVIVRRADGTNITALLPITLP